MRHRAVAAVLLGVLVLACAPAPEGPSRAAPTAAVVTTSSPSPSVVATPAQTRRPRPIELPPLPSQGVAVQDRHDVLFVSMRGDVVARLRGFELYYDWTASHAVIVRDDPHRFWLVRVGAHTVRPLASRDDASAIVPQFEPGFGPDAHPDLPWPVGSRVEGHPYLRQGFWAYALPSPDGSALLAQWSGECEVPNAFFVDDRTAVTVDGFRDLADAAESTALGWTTDGRAVVLMGGGECSSAFSTPGVYLFEGPGAGELLIATDGAARMWGTA